LTSSVTINFQIKTQLKVVYFYFEATKLILTYLIMLIILWSYFLCTYSIVPYYLPLLGSNIFFCTVFWNTLDPISYLRLTHRANITVQQLVELENYIWLFHHWIYTIFAHIGSNSPLPGFVKGQLELEKSINFIILLNECSTTKSINFKVITYYWYVMQFSM
jgi:hypothetical protein